jgi:hypothetical protein
MNCQGWRLFADGAQRAASNDEPRSAGVNTADGSKDRGLQRFAKMS